MAIDIFVNDGSATVSSGGTTAPAAGTSEAWTLSSVVGLAAASGVTQMRLIDPAAPSEIALLTNLSGTTATVTRGAEGTAPVAHTAGFTVKAVASAAALNSGLVPLGGVFGATPISPIAGNTYMAGNPSGPPGTKGSAGGAVLLQPIVLAQSATLKALGMYISTAASAGSVAELGIYSPVNAVGLPGSLLLDAGSIAVDSTGYKSIALTQELDPGLYWLATATTASFQGYATNSNLGCVYGYTGTPGGGTPPQNIYQSGYGTGALPSSITLADLTYTATLYASVYAGF